MPHLFVDLDDFVPGGAGGLDDGDVIPPRPAVLATTEELASAATVGVLHPYSDMSVPIVHVRGQYVARTFGEWYDVPAGTPSTPSYVVAPPTSRWCGWVAT